MAYAVTGVFAIAPVDSFKSRKLGNMWLKVIRRDDKSVIWTDVYREAKGTNVQYFFRLGDWQSTSLTNNEPWPKSTTIWVGIKIGLIKEVASDSLSVQGYGQMYRKSCLWVTDKETLFSPKPFHFYLVGCPFKAQLTSYRVKQIQDFFAAFGPHWLSGNGNPRGWRMSFLSFKRSTSSRKRPLALDQFPFVLFIAPIYVSLLLFYI